MLQLDFPKKRIVINLAPADIPKDSSSFDLAMAVSRQIQYLRNGSKTKTNASLSNREVKNLANLTTEAEQLLNQAAERLQISARSYMRLIKVARTIADLDESPHIEAPHISEAIQYRRITSQ